MQREDVSTDLLWTTNSPVQTMTPEEVNELANHTQQQQEPTNETNNNDSPNV